MQTEDSPLAGRTALLTGATSGIGIPTAIALLRAGARLLAVGRDPARQDVLAAHLARKVPGGEVIHLRADLTRMADVRRLAAEVGEQAPALHLLVNNAGAFSPRRVVTLDGLERTYAVNLFAPILLARLLRPALREAGGGARIVNVGSAASDRASSPLPDLAGGAGWSTMRAYERSKLALMMATFELARREDPGAVTANVVHPGVVATRIGEVGGPIGLVWRLARPFFRSPDDGAKPTLAACLSSDYEGRTGLYIKASGPAEPNPLARDPKLTREVWRRTSRLLGLAEDG